MRALLGLGRGRQRLRGQAGDSGGALWAHGLMMMHSLCHRSAVLKPLNSVVFNPARTAYALLPAVLNFCDLPVQRCWRHATERLLWDVAVAGGSQLSQAQKCVEVDIKCITAVSGSQPHSGLSRIVSGTGGGVRVVTMRLQQTGAQCS